MERIKRWKRYLRFLLQVILLEKPRGLDFTLQDQKLFQKSGGKYHGYSKTDERHLRDIFQKLDFSKGLKLLDVGCGKGVVLREAAKFPFERIAGIEISSELVRIARKNFGILGLEDRVECLEADAIEFGCYGDYNVFFFFNPFSEEILGKVLDRIFGSRRDCDPLILIYHNPVFLSALTERLPGAKRELLHDDCKGYDTCILFAE